MYNDDMKRPTPCEDACVAEPEHLAAMLDQATSLAGDALVMAYRLNSHMLGLSGADVPKAETKCFRDALALHNKQLLALCEELSKLSIGVGV